MKKLSTKILIILTLVVILLTIIKPTSYAEDSGGSGGSGAFIPRQQQEAVADYAQLFYKEGKEKNILLYSQNRFDRIRGYNFETSSNEYGQYDGVQSNGAPFTNMLVYDSASLIAFLYHQTLGMELSANKNSRDNVYICESFIEDARSTDAENHNFSFVGGSEKTYGSKELISMGDSGTLIPGDIIVYANQTHAMLYLGTNENIKFDELKISELRVQKMIRGFESTTHWQDTGENLPTDEFIDVEGLDNPHYFLHSANTEENVTISVLEAMSYGMPIVSSKVGGIPEIVLNGENGFLIEPGDKKDLCDALLKLKDDQSLRRVMGEKSKMLSLPHQPIYVEKQLQEMYNSI